MDDWVEKREKASSSVLPNELIEVYFSSRLIAEGSLGRMDPRMND